MRDTMHPQCKFSTWTHRIPHAAFSAPPPVHAPLWARPPVFRTDANAGSGLGGRPELGLRSVMPLPTRAPRSNPQGTVGLTPLRGSTEAHHKGAPVLGDNYSPTQGFRKEFNRNVVKCCAVPRLMRVRNFIANTTTPLLRHTRLLGLASPRPIWRSTRGIG